MKPMLVAAVVVGLLAPGVGSAQPSRSSLGVASPKPDAPILLDGVIVAAHPGDSVALIRRAGARRGRALRVGEALYGWTLIQVSEDGALFDTGGTTRRVYVGEISVAKQASPVAEVEEAPLAASSPVMSSDAATAVKSEPSPGGWTRRHIERARAEQRLARELPLILSETGLTPRVEDGVVRGLRITRLPDGTILSEAGLLPGDVLIRIDDTPVDSTRALVGLYRQVSSEDEIRVVVERRGQILKLAYAID